MYVIIIIIDTGGSSVQEIEEQKWVWYGRWKVLVGDLQLLAPVPFNWTIPCIG